MDGSKVVIASGIETLQSHVNNSIRIAISPHAEPLEQGPLFQRSGLVTCWTVCSSPGLLRKTEHFFFPLPTKSFREFPPLHNAENLTSALSWRCKSPLHRHVAPVTSEGEKKKNERLDFSYRWSPSFTLSLVPDDGRWM
jgi:hypothetical protein